MSIIEPIPGDTPSILPLHHAAAPSPRSPMRRLRYGTQGKYEDHARARGWCGIAPHTSSSSTPISAMHRAGPCWLPCLGDSPDPQACRVAPRVRRRKVPIARRCRRCFTCGIMRRSGPVPGPGVRSHAGPRWHIRHARLMAARSRASAGTLRLQQSLDHTLLGNPLARYQALHQLEDATIASRRTNSTRCGPTLARGATPTASAWGALRRHSARTRRRWRTS
jgi:hypothetical protein